jgi:formate/nitrite transporter FocA (FNT family)
MVWLIPSAKGSEFHVIALMTYLIAIPKSAHIVVGSVEVSLLAFAGVADVPTVLVQFILPALVGNIIGGTALFALLADAQVMQEL